MSPAKHALAAAILAWALLWPPLHRLLVARWDVNPWKLGGFAMYATPAPPVLVALFVPAAGHLRVLDERTLAPAVRAELARFRVRRHALGAFTRPDALARAALAAQPELPGLVIAVQRMRLDPGTARMTSRRDRYVYDRASLP